MKAMDSGPSLGGGLYSRVEAARLLRTPRQTLARWVEGYVREVRGVGKAYAPLIERGEAPTLSFGDLVELMYVRGFRRAGVSLQELRDAGTKFRREWGTSFPLASKRFATDGRHLLLDEGEVWRHALTGQQSAFFEEMGRQLVHVGDLASEWRPLGRERSVLLNPDRSFGKPIDDASGTHTHVLSLALAAEKDPSAVAWWYGTTTEAVRDAAEFEASLTLA